MTTNTKPPNKQNAVTAAGKKNNPNKNYAMYLADREAKRQAQPALPKPTWNTSAKPRCGNPANVTTSSHTQERKTGEDNAPRNLKEMQFWMVFSPSPDSEFEDICYKTNFRGFANLARADVADRFTRDVCEECVAIYDNEKDAAIHARALLSARNLVGSDAARSSKKGGCARQHQFIEP